MAKLPEIENGPRQEELSSLVAKELRRVLTQYDEVVKEHNSISSCEGGCKIDVTSSLSLTLQQALALSELRKELIEILRRFALGQLVISLEAITDTDQESWSASQWVTLLLDPLTYIYSRQAPPAAARFDNSHKKG